MYRVKDVCTAMAMLFTFSEVLMLTMSTLESLFACFRCSHACFTYSIVLLYQQSHFGGFHATYTQGLSGT